MLVTKQVVVMKKVMVEFGFVSRDYESVEKEVEIEFGSEEDFVRKCLLEEFGSEEKCVSYWNDFYGFSNMDEVVKGIINIKREEESIGEDLGYVCSEEGFFKVKDPIKM